MNVDGARDSFQKIKLDTQPVGLNKENHWPMGLLNDGTAQMGSCVMICSFFFLSFFFFFLLILGFRDLRRGQMCVWV